MFQTFQQYIQQNRL